MLPRIAAIAIASLLPLAASAQRAASLPLANADAVRFDRLLSLDLDGADSSEQQVIPLWASPDGRLMAIVALSSRSDGAPVLPPSPAFGGVSDLRIVDATRLFSAGLRVQTGAGLHADLNLHQLGNPSFFFAPQQECIEGACRSAGGQSWTDSIHAGEIRLGWNPDSSKFDLSLGMSWLGDGAIGANALMPTSGMDNPLDLAASALPEAYRINAGRKLDAHGIWALGPELTLDLSAALTRAQLAPIWYGLGGAQGDWNQSSLGIGLASGSVRGTIVGRIDSYGLPALDGTRRWSGIDLGVSWRTPWQGEVTVGAQNFWSKPLDPGATNDTDSAKARMPYVQYRQDL